MILFQLANRITFRRFWKNLPWKIIVILYPHQDLTQDLNEPTKIVEVPIENLLFLASNIFFGKLKILKY